MSKTASLHRKAAKDRLALSETENEIEQFKRATDGEYSDVEVALLRKLEIKLERQRMNLRVTERKIQLAEQGQIRLTIEPPATESGAPPSSGRRRKD